MKSNTKYSLFHSSYLTRGNQSYIEELYKEFLNDPNAIDKEWNLAFNNLFNNNNEEIKKRIDHLKYSLSSQSLMKQSVSSNMLLNLKSHSIQEKIFQLINAFRKYGHKSAKLDPLGMCTQDLIEYLNLDFYKFQSHDFQKKIDITAFHFPHENINLTDLYKVLKKIYCGSVGIEYMHLDNEKEILWIQNNIESNGKMIELNITEQKKILNEIIIAKKIEEYLGISFPGTKRFSLEGGDVLIPILKEIIQYAIFQKTKKIILSMAHRGRLNVLINILNKPPRDLFKEFSIDNVIKYKYSGDVKYHQGFSTKIKIDNKSSIDVLLLSNPSHLEIINPVAMGLTRAYIDKSNNLNIQDMILPITIHGDAAISGQGIVQETLNMSKIPAYDVGGTIRIIINNQIGFTTSNSNYLRSSQYCTDIGKMLQIPIFHVNADDPEKAIFVIRTALNFRNTFKRDVLIDLVCYRRHGHNEVDEPSVTQPLMYKKIRQHPSIFDIYSNYLKNNGIVNNNEILEMINTFQNFLNDEKTASLEKMNKLNQKNKNTTFLPLKSTIQSIDDKKICFQTEYNYLKKLAYSISSLPKHFNVHPRVNKIYQMRMEMVQENQFFDWGAAEILAYATLLDNGVSVRLSGEDTARGTFFHRHVIVHNQDNGETYIPLSNLHKRQGNFFIWDSVLSEEGALAFEYGYSLHSSPDTLIIWEAQFGDFSNGAQIVIDQFISSGEQKWGQTSNLVLLLPHGYEGQGPEHSSARLERYLQLCAENNMQICIPTTPSQIYHLLRYQILYKIRKPLIIMSPKSLLRHPMVRSSFKELTKGNFQKIIKEKNKNINHQDIKHVLICSGKIYYDLLEQRNKNKKYDTTIVRIEQLYPFPIEEMRSIISLYSHVKNFTWCQEEPENQGAWYYSKNYFYKIIPKKFTLRYVGRPVSAAPAVGHFSLHQKQQKILLDSALNIN